MSNTAWTVGIMVFAHFISDWKCQPREIALAKSTEFGALLVHLLIVTVGMLIGFTIAAGCGFYQLSNNFGWALLFNAIIHGVIDWNIWGGYKSRAEKAAERKGVSLKDFKYWEHKGFYDTIGFDQFLHLLTLAILFL